MKLLGFLTIFFVLLWSGLNAQTVIPISNLTGNVTNFSLVADSTYLLTINTINDESDVNYNGTTILADGKFVVWQNCERYIVTNITCGTCYTLSTAIQVEVTADVAANGSPTFGLINIVHETDNLSLGSYISGSSDPEQQCIDAYYKAKLDNLTTTEEIIIGTAAPVGTPATTDKFFYDSTNNTFYFNVSNVWVEGGFKIYGDFTDQDDAGANSVPSGGVFRASYNSLRHTKGTLIKRD